MWIKTQLWCNNSMWTESYARCSQFIIVLISKLSNCEIKDPAADLSTVMKSDARSWCTVQGHGAYREVSLWDRLLVHYSSRPLEPLIMILHFCFLFFAPVDLLNSFYLIPSMFLSGFERHTRTRTTNTHTYTHAHTYTAIRWGFTEAARVVEIVKVRAVLDYNGRWNWWK